MVHTSWTWIMFFGSDLMHKFNWCKISEASRVVGGTPSNHLPCAYFSILWQKYPPSSCKVLMKCLNPLKPRKIWIQSTSPTLYLCIAFFADSCSHLEIRWFDEACLLPLEADEKAESSTVGMGCSVETCRFPDLQNGNGAVFWLERNLGKDRVFLYFYRVL